MEGAPVPPEIKDILEKIKNPPRQEPAEHIDIYTDNDPVHRLDDGTFLGSKKIRTHAWFGPGVLEVYAPWCPYCQQKVQAVKVLAEQGDTAVYVLDGTVNPTFSYAHNIKSYPTFLRVLPDGTIGEELSDLTEI
jgi:hypothetical protein